MLTSSKVFSLLLAAAGALAAQYPAPSSSSGGPLYPKTASTSVVTITLDAPKEGSKSVSGTVLETLASGVTGRVDVLDGSVISQTVTDLTIDTTAKTFKANTTNALKEGQTLRVILFDDKKNLIGFADTTVASLAFDWGRVRAYFSAGALFARNDGKFGSADPFLALNVDYNWFNSQKIQTCPARPAFNIYKSRIGRVPGSRYSTDEAQDLGGGQGTKDETCEKPTAGHYLVNTYFEGRLTQVSFPSTSGDASTTASTTAAAGASPNLITTDSGAQLEAGFYLPKYWSGTRWQLNGQDQAMFIAPLVKGGFSIPGGGEITTGTAVDGKEVYGFYSAGFRIGHFTLPSDPQRVAPELLSYIDATWGRWDNFRLLSKTPGETFRVPVRFNSTGRLKVPGTQFYLGYEVSTGSGPDDFRVFVGTRFDAGKLLGKLIPSGVN